MLAHLLVAALAGSAFAKTCNRQYTVKAGDYCDSISAAQNVSTYQLAAISQGTVDSECSNLQIDAVLCLGYEGEDCKDTHVVIKDETCEGIQAVAGINSTLLYGNNPQINEDCSNIYYGQVLCVAKSIAVPVPSGPVTLSLTTVAPTATPTDSATAAPTATDSATAAPTATPATAAAAAASDPDDDDDEDLPWCSDL